MPGIYSRDNFAQLLANAIENAQARRQAYVDREAARTNSNVQAIGNFAKALGRTYETWGDDEAKLAALQKEREEALKAQQEEDSLLRAAKADARPDIGQQLAQSNSYNTAMANRDMTGYHTTPMVVVPNYSQVMAKRGIYRDPRQDFDGVL
jgi:hypothetical protein